MPGLNRETGAFIPFHSRAGVISNRPLAAELVQTRIVVLSDAWGLLKFLFVDEADFAIVIAVTDPDRGVHRGGATAFLVDRAMGWTSTPIQTMGPATPASLFFDDVRVPSANILGELGQGFELGMKWILEGRWRIPAWAVGMAERALAMANDYANTSETFGSPIGTNQAIQWVIAGSEVELEAARSLVPRAAWPGRRRPKPCISFPRKASS